MGRRVLVTGASGFVGSHTLAALGAVEGVEPIALVRDPRRLPVEFGGEVLQGDVRDRDFVERALQGADAVCVCAAWTSAWGHAKESRELFLEPTIGFLDAAARQGIERIVFPSSTTAPVLRRLARNGGDRAAHRLWPHMASVIRIEDHLVRLVERGVTTVSLRLGLFVGERYGLGLLPILLPRLRSHLVPWVGRGRTALPLIAGKDVGRAMALAATREGVEGAVEVDVVSGEIPTAREVLDFLHQAYGYPLPHFGVSFPLAYGFARVMEAVSRVTPWDPFIARSVVLLLEETAADNDRARRLLGYEPQVPWRDAVRAQMAEMLRDRVKGLPMARAVPSPLRKVSA